MTKEVIVNIATVQLNYTIYLSECISNEIFISKSNIWHLIKYQIFFLKSFYHLFLIP